MYALLRKLLFRLDAEFSHHLVFSLLRALYHLPGVGWLLRRQTPSLPVEVMGIKFPNPVGLAAGLDKNADLAPLLADFGFGFLELGTVTPRPQPGNPKMRSVTTAPEISPPSCRPMIVTTTIRELRSA